MCELSNNSDDSFAIWEWQVGTQWSAFMPDISSQIEGFYNEGTNPSASSSSVHPNPQILTIGRWAYKIDFNLMCQLNTTTGRRRLIRRQTFTEPQWYGQTEPHLYIRFPDSIQGAIESEYRSSTEIPIVWDSWNIHPSQMRQRHTAIQQDMQIKRITKEDVRLPSVQPPSEGAVVVCTPVLSPVLFITRKSQSRRPILRRRFIYDPSTSIGVILDDLKTVPRKKRRLNHTENPDDPNDSNKEDDDQNCAFCLEGLSVDSVPNLTQKGQPKSDSSNNSETKPFDNSIKDGELNCQLQCGHLFHRDCLKLYLAHNNKSLKCPLCCAICTENGYGTCPRGTMTVEILPVDPHYLISGHEEFGIITIHYSIQSGIQGQGHPKPGKPFHGTERIAFLPNSSEGRKVLALLIQAFLKGHTFTIGRSVTTGQSNVVIWTIHHKTSIHGGILNYGYPDPGYLDRVTEELEFRGIQIERGSDPLLWGEDLSSLRFQSSGSDDGNDVDDERMME